MAATVAVTVNGYSEGGGSNDGNINGNMVTITVPVKVILVAT